MICNLWCNLCLCLRSAQFSITLYSPLSVCLSVSLSLSLCLSLFLSLSLALTHTNVSSSSVLFAVFKNPHVLSNLYARVIQHVYTCYSTYMHVIFNMCAHVIPRLRTCFSTLPSICERVVRRVCTCNSACVQV